jgi:hypothetical protein
MLNIQCCYLNILIAVLKFVFKTEKYITQSCAFLSILNNAKMLVTKNKKPQTINLFT